MKSQDVTEMQARWVKSLVQATTKKLRDGETQFLPDVGIEIARLHTMVLEDQQDARRAASERRVDRLIPKQLRRQLANQCNDGLQEQRKFSTLKVGRAKVKS
jgi:hypothetical protein